MDFPSDHDLGAIAVVLVLLLLIIIVGYNHHRSSGAKRLYISPPEPAGAWPIVGHLLHLLSLGGKVRPAFRILAAMADELGPVFSIRLGMFRTVVVSDHEAVKECLTTNDKVLASRPASAAARIMGYNFALFAFAPYGPLWREMRKITTLELLSHVRLSDSTHVQVSELQAGIKDLYNNINTNMNLGAPREKEKAALVMMSQWFEHLNFNVILRMAAGKRYFNNMVHGDEDVDEGSPLAAIKKFLELFGATVASDVIPFLEWLDLQGHLSSMKHVAKELDGVLQGWLEEHKRVDNDIINTNTKPDLIDVMLTKLADTPLFGYSSDTIIKATILTMIVGGYETTSTTSTWLLSALLNNRHVMKHVQKELDLKVGRERWVEPSDIPNLVYLKAIVKETLRLYPVGPLVPREAIEDCHVAGYHIPKGSRLLVNVWKLHRDHAIWSNPEEFRPDRFLTDHPTLDVFGHHSELVPFGAGRRSCPGINLALQMLHLTAARLLQGFDMTTPSNSPVDMTEGASFSLPKATPLELMLTPRLRAELY